MDDVKTGFRWHVPGRARLWAKGDGKVNQRKRLIEAPGGPKLPLFGTRETSAAMGDKNG
jgi:hypothetical protein